ncbi:MAG: Lrp/AsnC family transcriptional regulator [Gammaproteobacteria bacterium]|nr:Lrp/AsnC family transcriptional regulator [Gammaproteobacteria bacterium]
MDRFDRRILAILQVDADMSIADLAERVGLSKNPCWRRVQKLQSAGVIARRVALLDAARLNVGTTVFVKIRTDQHNLDWLRRLRTAVDGLPEVTEFYRMAGDMDYLLKVVVPSIEAFDAVYKRLIEKIDIFEVSSYFAMEEIKNSTELPLDYA